MVIDNQKMAVYDSISRYKNVAPVSSGGGSFQRFGEDLLDISQKAIKLSSKQSEYKEKFENSMRRPIVIDIGPDRSQYGRLRAQVLDYLLSSGIAASRALPQTEKVLMRMGYIRPEPYPRDKDQDSKQDFRRAPKAESQPNKTAFVGVESVNILI